jgi:hypothetical protein
MMKLRGFGKRGKGSLFLIFLVFFSVRAFAEDAISLYIENDSRILKPNHKTDRHYTHGTKLVYLTQPKWQWLEDFSQWHFADLDESVDTAVGFFLGQNIYTPDHVDEPAKRNDDDMVYAGWLYTGMFAQRATDDLLDHLELNVWRSTCRLCGNSVFRMAGLSRLSRQILLQNMVLQSGRFTVICRRVLRFDTVSILTIPLARAGWRCLRGFRH